ncbi:sugar ABC transporter substrate-binding protein [Kallotenue papyrolyticum]|uniref:sugar ABC transporter substrate-binding protein n=1 Tax=Kallotenue papyrolyticum TaxID=1325125 RepID=UPI0004785B60|nr:extracellular solute-binding protein [Kallotenue papyrolyticum]
MNCRAFLLVGLITLLVLLSACSAQSGTTPASQSDPSSATASPSANAGPSAEPTAPPEQVGSGTTKIVIWHRWEGEYYKAIKQIFADYAIKNNVQIELLLVPDVANKAQIAVPSGQGPDIIAWVNDRIGSSALNEIIQPLDDYGITPGYLREQFAPVAADAMIYRHRVYGIPESMEAMTFIYNKALIAADDVPASTDDLIAKAKEYNAAHPGTYFFVYNARGDIYAAAPWFHGAGVALVTPDGTTEIASENGVKAARLIKAFSEIMPQELGYDEANTLFMDQKAAIIMNGPWVIADYQAKGIDFGLAPIPVVSSSGQPGKPFVGVKLLMLAANAKNSQAAVELMKYYGSADVQMQLARVNKQVPANRQAQQQVKDDPIIAGFIAQTANGVPMPNSEFINAMWDPFNKMIEVIWTGAAAPEQAVQDAAALFEESVADLK